RFPGSCYHTFVISVVVCTRVLCRLHRSLPGDILDMHRTIGDDITLLSNSGAAENSLGGGGAGGSNNGGGLGSHSDGFGDESLSSSVVAGGSQSLLNSTGSVAAVGYTTIFDICQQLNCLWAKEDAVNLYVLS